MSSRNQYFQRLTIFIFSVLLTNSASAQNLTNHSQSKTAAPPTKRLTKSASGQSKVNKRLTQADAVKLVAARPEVKAWKQQVAKAWTKERPVQAVIEFDRKENGQYVVHAYEIVPDDAESSHTATFNWYHVSATGAVKTEF